MRNLKWGLIGAGDIARRRVAPALRDAANSELFAVSRARAELAESFARECGARRWHSDWRDLIADAETEAVYLATPVYLHAAQAIAAAEAGKHVLCEKPMAMDVLECEKMTDAARASGVKLGVAYYRHFYPVIERIKQIIAAGEIGKTVVAQINAFEYFDPSPDHPRRWLLEKEKSGGGPMMDFGCHRLEVLMNLCGAIRRVESLTANVAFDRETEDTASAIFQFESGAVANLTVTHAAREAQDTLRIFGTRGSIDVPVLNQGEIRIKTESGERAENLPPAQNVHAPLIADFVAAVLTNREPAVGGELGRMVNQIEASIYEKG